MVWPAFAGIRSASTPHVIRHIEVRRDHQLVLTYAHGINTIANLAPLVARGDTGEQSDVDVLVDFEESSTFDGYFGPEFYLEDLLGREVDLVTGTGLRSVFRPYVEEETIEILNLTKDPQFTPQARSYPTYVRESARTGGEPDQLVCPEFTPRGPHA